MIDVLTDNLPSREEPSSGLQGYFDLKLELAAVIRSAVQLFHEGRDARRENQARLLLSRLAEDRFNLAVVGQFKRGKSSLMNAVIGMDRLPTGVLPLTSVVTTVRYGERESVLVQRRGFSMAEEIPLARLEEYVTEKGNPGNRKRVTLAEIRLPAEILRLGFHFIDTPGIGSAIAANTATTYRFLPEADAVIFVTGFESTMNETELAFLRNVARYVRKIFFAVNKADLVSPGEKESVLDSVRRLISAELGDEDPQVFAVSARDGLAAKLSGDPAALSGSGLPELESALTRFLTRERASVALLRCLERAIVLLAPERIENAAQEIRASLSDEAARAMKRDWESRIAGIETEYANAVEALQRRIRSEFPPQLEEGIAEHCADLRGKFSVQVDSLLAEKNNFNLAQELREIPHRARDTADDRRHQWISSSKEKFPEILWSLSSETAGELERLYDKALEAAAALFPLPASLGRWAIAKHEGIFVLKTTSPLEWRPGLTWELDLLWAKWVRRKVRRRYTESLDQALLEYRNGIINALAETGSEWAAALAMEGRNALQELAAQVSAVLEGRAAPAASAQATELMGRLEEMYEKLTSESRGEYSERAASLHSSRALNVTKCFVCERAAAELFDFFRETQYDLFIKESERQAHAARGGFCPLHTWQYEMMASPQGVSLSYAPLLAETARRLRRIASSGDSTQEIQDRLRLLDLSHDTCPACRRIAQVEESAIQEFLNESFGEENGTDLGLCLQHLAVAISREFDLETARNLLLKEARILDRVSQDMQTYSLKDQAIRRELIEARERDAYLVGLSLLAGHRKLSAA